MRAKGFMVARSADAPVPSAGDRCDRALDWAGLSPGPRRRLRRRAREPEEDRHMNFQDVTRLLRPGGLGLTLLVAAGAAALITALSL